MKVRGVALYPLIITGDFPFEGRYTRLPSVPLGDDYRFSNWPNTYTSDFRYIGDRQNFVIYITNVLVDDPKCEWHKMQFYTAHYGLKVTWLSLQEDVARYVIPSSLSVYKEKPDLQNEVTELSEKVTQNDSFHGCTWDTFPKDHDLFVKEYEERNALVTSSSQRNQLNDWVRAANGYFKSSEYDYDAKPFGHILTSKKRVYKLVGNRVKV